MLDAKARLVRARDELQSGAQARLDSLRDRFSALRMHGEESAGEKASNNEEIEELERRSWHFLLSPSLWGSPVHTIDGPCGPIVAWKYWLPKDDYGSANSMVKAQGIVRASPEEIFEMIFDSSRTKEYNKYSVGRTDVETKGPKTKIVWNRTNPPGTKRPHDFCTLMHGRVYPKNGTNLLMTTATDHAKAKTSSEFLRSEILLGVNQMRVIGPGRTELTTISHVKTCGVHPFLSEKFAASSAVDFIKRVDEVLGGTEEAEAAGELAVAAGASSGSEASGQKEARKLSFCSPPLRSSRVHRSWP